MYHITNANNWDISHHTLTIDTAKRNDYTSLKYDRKSFYLKTPKMLCPYGINQFGHNSDRPFQDAYYRPFGLSMFFDSNQESDTFLQKIRQFDDFMVSSAHEKKWFGNMPQDEVKAKYHGLLHSGNAGKFPHISPIFEQYDSNTLVCHVHSESNVEQYVSPDNIRQYITPNHVCQALISISVWYDECIGFGTVCQVNQLKIHSQKFGRVFPDQDPVTYCEPGHYPSSMETYMRIMTYNEY
jgi:hypothetical protein